MVGACARWRPLDAWRARFPAGFPTVLSGFWFEVTISACSISCSSYGATHLITLLHMWQSKRLTCRSLPDVVVARTPSPTPLTPRTRHSCAAPATDAHDWAPQVALALAGRTPPRDRHLPKSRRGKCHIRRVQAASDSHNTGSDRASVAAPCCLSHLLAYQR